MLNARWLVRQWREPTCAAQLLLRPISWLFGPLVALRRMAYRRRWLVVERLPVPVIVVGNLVVGGSGKTPLVVHLVTALKAAGWCPGVVSRGHGGREGLPRRLDRDADPLDVGDEPALIMQRCGCPVAVGHDRPQAARLLLDDCDVIVADDGLQHYRLGRDLEIVVLDGDIGTGNGRLLPAGPLREPRTRLAACDFVARRGGDSGQGWHFDVIGGAPQPLWHDQSAGSGTSWDGQSVHAVAGIGVPERFFTQLEREGLDVERHPFADHHAFVPADLAFGDERAILMTEKDAVKCRAFATDRMWYVPAKVIDRDGLAAAVIARLESGASDGS